MMSGSGNSSGAASTVGADGRHDDDAALTEFLSSLMDYTPTIPDELVEHYLGRSGFNCPDLRLYNLVDLTRLALAKYFLKALDGRSNDLSEVNFAFS